MSASGAPTEGRLERLVLFLQPKLNLKVSQRQVLTPGLVQMVSVLALNKLELKDMINSEMIENPVLEEIEESAATLEERSGIEGDRERSAQEMVTERSEAAASEAQKDPFDEIDFGSYFQDYLDPGFKTASQFEDYDKPSFEHFLAQPSTLSDHLLWQLGALNLKDEARAAAELVVGNLDGNGYLTASDEELAEALHATLKAMERPAPIPFERAKMLSSGGRSGAAGIHGANGTGGYSRGLQGTVLERVAAAAADGDEADGAAAEESGRRLRLELRMVVAAREAVHQLDPIGVGARDLRECLLIQIKARWAEARLVLARRAAVEQQDEEESRSNGQDIIQEHVSQEHVQRRNEDARGESVFSVALQIVERCLGLLQKKDMRELTRSCGGSAQEVQAAVEFIRTLDPRPGQRYNTTETRLIEPDVAFVKRDAGYVVLMNEEEMPALRLNGSYRRMLRQKGTEKEVREYVKERYKSAIQLLRNIEQRKNTIVRTCEAIVRRQGDFLEKGEEGLRPMMIKDVAEEIGVHPSTVSRAVANKYVHTPQGVYELRFFFSEAVNGPEGGDLPLVLLKRKVKKLIEEEDARKPLTDDQLAAELKAQGINVTRRTVAKYREDMQIPSTHQRRVR